MNYSTVPIATTLRLQMSFKLKSTAWALGSQHLIRSHEDRPPSPYLRSLKRETNAQEQSRLFHVVVLVAENADSTRLHHQAEWERQIITQPSLGECPGCVAMGNQDDILRFAVMHVRCLNLANLLDQDIETRREFGRRPGFVSENFQYWLPQVFPYSPPSQPSLQISHSWSLSRPRSLRSALISLVTRPS